MPLQLENLFRASYKNVAFLSPRSNISGGRKDVLHEFPNRDTQNIEDLGLRPRTYNMAAIITGDDYLTQRNRFIRTLEEGGAGTLVHPFYGLIANIVARSFTLEESEDNLGVATFNIVFALNDSIGLPVPAGNSLGTISQQNSNVFTAVENLITNFYEVQTKFLGNFDAAKNKLLEITSAFTDSSNVLQASSTQINGFRREIEAVERNVNSITVVPSEVATSITELFASFSDLFEQPPDQVFSLSQLFDFGANDTVINVTTAGLAQRKLNRDILNASMNTLALSNSYENASLIEFLNVNEVDVLVDTLEEQFQLTVDLDGLDIDTINAITDLRKITQQFFDQSRLTTSQIVDARTNTLPVRVISYQYYKDSSRAQQLIDVNEDPNVTFFKGPIKVLSE